MPWKFVLVLGGIINDLTTYAYPKISIANVILTLLTLIPSISILVITKIKPNIKKVVKRIVLCLCVVAIPFSFIMPYGIVTCSETTDFRNYRDFDPDCLATRNKVFNEVFPTWPHYFEKCKKWRRWMGSCLFGCKVLLSILLRHGLYVFSKSSDVLKGGNITLRELKRSAS